MPSRRGAQHAANILGALSEATRPLSAYDLLDRLRPTGVAAPLTVYRALDKLVASGKVHRIESLNAFMACKTGQHHGAEHDREHEHEGARQAPRSVGFAICDGCGSVEEFVDDSLFPKLDRILIKKGFSPRTTAIEVHGVCGECLVKTPHPIRQSDSQTGTSRSDHARS